MTSFILKINTARFYTPDRVNVSTRQAIHAHEVPRIGESVNIAGLFPKVENINLKVVAVVHPVSAEPYIHVPEVYCDASTLPEEIFSLIKDSYDWKTTSPTEK